MGYDDRLRGKFHIGVQLLDRGIVPRLDFAEEDLGERVAIKRQFVGLDAIEVDHGNVTADDRRELHQSALSDFLGRKRHIGSAEGHGLGFDLLDAAARADRLIVEPVAGFLFVGVSPLGIDGIRERGARARNVCCNRDGRGQYPSRRSGDGQNFSIHADLLVPSHNRGPCL